MNEDHKIILWVFGGCVATVCVMMNALTPEPDPSRDPATVEMARQRDQSPELKAAIEWMNKVVARPGFWEAGLTVSNDYRFTESQTNTIREIVREELMLHGSLVIITKIIVPVNFPNGNAVFVTNHITPNMFKGFGTNYIATPPTLNLEGK